MKITTIILTFTFLTCFSAGWAQPFLNWAKQLEGTNTVKRIKSTVTDNDGNVYNYGDFNGTVDFDPGAGVYNLTAQNFDVFIQKLNRYGELIWAIRIGAAGIESAGHITYSPVTNKIIINGKFEFFGVPGQEVDFDPGTGTVFPSEYRNHFVLRLWGNNGAFDWLGLLNLPQGNIGPMVIDNNQDFYLTGNYHAPSGNIDLNPAPAANLNYGANAGANYDAFLTKIANNGSLLWSRHIRSQNTSGRLNINAIDLSPWGVTIGGELFGQVHPEHDLSTNMLYVLTSQGGSDAIIYNYPMNLGIGGFGFGINTSNNEGIYSLKRSRTDGWKTFITGYFNGTMNIYPPTNSAFHLNSSGLADQFITCADVNYNIIWSNKTGSQYQDQGLYLTLNNKNEVYILTQLEGNNGSIDINPNAGMQTVTMEINDVLIQKLDSNGVYQYGHLFTDGNAYPRGINTWNTNNVYLAVDLESAGNFDADPTTGTFNLTGYGSNATGLTIALNDCAAPQVITANNPVCAGSTLNLSVPSIPGASYSWIGPNAFSGNTNTVAIPNAQTSNSGPYELTTTVGGCVYPTVRSTVTVGIPTAITVQPSNQTICNGNTVNLSVGATGSSLTYQWRKNGVIIPGATNATYSIANAQPTDGGNYDVIVTGQCGSVTSNISLVDVQSVLPAPGPYTGPTTFCQNNPTTISVPVIPGATSYTWIVPGGWGGTVTSTTNSNTVTTPFIGGGGIISVRGNNSCGSGNVLNINVFSSAGLGAIGSVSGNTNVCQNTTHTYTVPTVTNATSYTWILPSGWTGSSTTNTITVTVGSTSGTIGVFASNASCGNTSTSNLAVTVNSVPSAPGIISGNTNVCSGTSQVYSVAAVPGATVYTWGIPGGWSGFSNTNSITATAGSNSGNISVTANNACGVSPATILAVNSSSATIFINTQPQAQTLCLGQNGTLSVTASGANLNYQWRFNGNPIAGATSSSLSLSSVTITQAGNYDVVISNNCNTITSATVFVTVNTAPTIISQPQSATVCQGGLVTFGVNFSGTPSAYQWRLNGNIVPGANSPMFTIPSAQQSDEGNYTLDYTTSCGVLTSQIAFLDVQVTPSFIQQPVGATICEGQALNLSVQTQGDADYYQWYMNSSPIVGATSSSYTLPSATSAQAGTYTVIAGNNVCNNSALSQDAVVQVNTAPIFSQQPVGGTYCQGDVVTLSPQFANNVTNFEWLYLGSPVPGGNGSVLTLNNIQPTQAGTYVLYAENQCGGVYSSLANIQVNPSYQQTIQQTICFGDSYAFDGNNLTQSGTYVEQLQTMFGCDSVTTLELTVLPENRTILSASICLGDSYTFDGQNLTTSGTYSAYYTAANGCDSLVELSLVVVDPNQVYPTSVSLCPGNSLIWGTQTLTQAGVYQQLFTAVGGCDSLVELTLSYFNLPTVSIANNSGNLSVTGGLSNYQWYVNGVAINGATSETHVATQDGNYHVVFETIDGCNGSSDTVFVTGVQVAIQEAEIPSLRVFPNPTSDEITIAFPTPVDQPVKIDLMDGTGRLIRTLTKNVQQQEVELSLADLPAGCYLLKVNEYQVHQIIKQ